MNLISLLAALAAAPLTTGYVIDPPEYPFPGASTNCSAWLYTNTTLTCNNITSHFDITQDDFKAWNPTLFNVVSNCVVYPDYDYCIGVNTTTSPTTTAPLTSDSNTNTPTTASATTSATTYPPSASVTGPPYPKPYSGIPDCAEYYRVTSNDTGNEVCEGIASRYGISVAQLYEWNTYIIPWCFVFVDEVLCVKVNETAGSSTAVDGSAATTTTTGDEAAEPTEIGSIGTRVSPFTMIGWAMLCLSVLLGTSML
ncbi:hypothetical protein BJY04DRAFT_197925, partial [Aspergillus karnatakaensis]|uniref:LysM peptidoglycan-binding domain-containing protein n=1 Tax=Aspergillus karnatakaensis TaxID=1810916 RepID=UPI003CCCFC3B